MYGTDPLRADTDRGGRPDGAEVRAGLDPTWSGDDGPPPVLTHVSGVGYGHHVFEASEMTSGLPVTLASSVRLDTSATVPGCAEPTPYGIGPSATFHDTEVPTGRTVTLEVDIPAVLVGTVYFVAVQPGSCRVSSVVELTLP